MPGGLPDCSDGARGGALLTRTSVDSGASWSAVRTLYNFSATGGYVAPVVDAQRGQILLFFNVNFSEVWRRRSADGGATWDVAANMTRAMGSVAPGPGAGVQLRSGRLALAVHAATNCALLSDDGGVTWRKGGDVPFNGSGLASGGESQLVDDPARGPNALIMFIRVSSSNADWNHALAESDDAGESWRPPRVVPQVTGPTCEGSIGRRADGTILLSAPNNFHWRYPADRRNLTVWSLRRNGSSYALSGEARIWAGPAAYSGLTREGDFIMFEGGPDFRYQSVIVTQVPPGEYMYM